MAEQIFEVNCGFFDSVDQDRLYSADEMNRPYKRIISNGVFATPSGTPSTDLQVVSAANGMNIMVKAGQGLFGDKWFENPSDFVITVPSNTEITPRRDSVIVQVDKRTSGRVGNIVYRTGVASSNPQPPAMGTVENVIEYRLANIYVAAGASYIGNDAIVDLRGSSECPWITSLIYQVDTSTLFTQWNAAYANYYERITSELDAFLATLVDDLSINMNLQKETSQFVTTAENTTTVPIGINRFDPTTDLLEVYINGLRANDDEYAISANNQNITLTNALPAGQTIDFMCIKKLLGNPIVGEAVVGSATLGEESA